MRSLIRISLLLIVLTGAVNSYSQSRGRVSGTVSSPGVGPVGFASVSLKGTRYGCTPDTEGHYTILAPAGEYILTVSAVGYGTVERPVELVAGRNCSQDIEIREEATKIDEVVINGNGVRRVKESAYNAIAIDAKGLHNTTLDLAGALSKVPGVKLRESGGVGSDVQFSLDGFSGKHIKFFIDGVPMDGMGSSFGINNIPVNFAERIEVYRGVVPVGFGADALGGVVNIVTGNKRRTFVDASYSYGSFNTHRSYVNAGHTTKGGFLIEVNAYQNYSDNNYKMYTAVKDLYTGGINDNDKVWVRRFHDTYHNETAIVKAGVVGKRFADRLTMEVKLSQSYKEIQNGVNQDIVFGGKLRKGYSIMPSLQYMKRNFLTKGLDVGLTVNYNYNVSHNIDTTTSTYNWRGESRNTDDMGNPLSPGEQRYQDSKFNSDSWNGTFNASYRIADRHYIVLNHVLSAYDRRTAEAKGTVDQSSSASINKRSRKNITGLSYRISKRDKWNVSVFGKYYNQFGEGPRNTSTSGGYNYEVFSESVDALGYGAAGTLFFLNDFQLKLSYEKALRLPSTEELFGDDDLEMGSVTLKPEKSDNYNLGLSYSKNVDKHSIYVEGGLLYRDTKDYIKRLTDQKYSGGLFFGTYENHGKVKTLGINGEVRYGYSRWFSVGGNVTLQNIRDREKYLDSVSKQESMTYGSRMPNIPYFFWNADVAFHLHGVLGKGNVLTLAYDNLYVRRFPRFEETMGDPDTKDWIPTQFSHNIRLMYSIKNGRYNISAECRNLTNELIYDNYYLQKAGRAFYVKFRYFFGK